MFGLSSIAAKLIGVAVLVAIVGGIILVQHLRINHLTDQLAVAQAQRAALQTANDGQAQTIDELTRDKAAFEARAASAEKAAAEAKATVVTKTETIIKRITANPEKADKEPVSPALRKALETVR